MSKKLIILEAIGNGEPITREDIFDQVSERTEQTEQQLYAYLAFLKGKQDQTISQNGTDYYLTALGRNYLASQVGTDTAAPIEPDHQADKPAPAKPAAALAEPDPAPPRSTKERDTFPEILAMDAMTRALDCIEDSPVAQRRVLTWVNARYGFTLKVSL